MAYDVPSWAGQPWWGFPLVAAAATCFAVNSTLARLVYDAGSDALTVNTVRSVAALAIVYCVFRVLGVGLRLPRRERLAAWGFGVLTAGYSFCLFKSIEYMPVALAVVVFYTYPLYVAVMSWVLGRERPSWPTALALVAAFAGLAFALDIWRGGPHPLGMLYAGLSALGLGSVILMQPYVIVGQDARAVTLHLLVASTVILVAVSLLLGHLNLPVGQQGGLAMAGVTGFYCFAFVGFYIGMSRIGPIPASVAMNFEPVASLLLGHFLLGQHLRLSQVLGAGLVVAAILSTRLVALRRR